MGTGIQKGPQIRLIVGLGNPGEEYIKTRHNIGFMLIDRLLEKIPQGSLNKQFQYQSYYWKGSYAGRSLILQKPQTYMNLSGNAVLPLARAEKIAPEEILVVHDDMDIPLGRIRIRKNGSSGGHNGIKSIIQGFNSESFSRLRIGIGKMANGRGSADFVLSEFQGADWELCQKILDTAADAVILALRRDLQSAMNQYNPVDLTLPAEALDNSKSKSLK